MSGIRVERYFTQEGVDPLSQVSYKYVGIREVDSEGNVAYTVNAEVPDFWSDQSAEIVAKKYFRRAGVNGGGETSVRQVVERLVDYWTYWGKRYGYFATDEDAQAFRDEMAYMLIHQIAAPNSPQFFNSGLALKYGITGKNEGRYYYDVELGKVVPAPDTYTHPQASACFLTEVGDDLLGEGGIYDALKVEATIFKAGAGAGANYSYLRGKGEPLSGGGTSSGMMSFLKLFDVGGGTVKSGGVTRRAARMVVVDADHPEILEFVRWKAEEEEKAEALASAGYDVGFEGPVYTTISGQSANNSIRVFDKFFEALDNDGLWALTRRTDGKVHKMIKAKELWDTIVHAAWRSADPGLHFATAINEWNPVPNDGEIRTSNPCVTGDTLIATAKGLMPISKLMGEISCHVAVDRRLGKGYESASPAWMTGIKPVLRLETEEGHVLRLTANHEVLTPNGWVKAGDLKPGDRVLIHHGEGAFGEEGPRELGHVLGWLVGDGHVSKERRQAILYFYGDKRRYSKMLRDDLQVCLPDEFNHYVDGQVGVVTQEQYDLERISSASLWELANSYGLADEKLRVPEVVFRGTKEMQAAFLRALFTADGTVINQKQGVGVRLGSISLDLLRDVQLLLLNFGIDSRIYQNRRGGKLTHLLPDGHGGVKEYEVKETHEIAISGIDAVTFRDEIGFFDGDKQEKLNELLASYTRGPYRKRDAFTAMVKEIKDDGVEPVYDLTVNNVHAFSANGIVVHNCSEVFALDGNSCNLASLRLTAFYDWKTREFNVEALQHAARLWTIMLDITVKSSSYPTERIAAITNQYNLVGLGITDLGGLVMGMGLPYDSDAARQIGGSLMAVITAVAWKTSAELARELGAYPRFEANREQHLRTIKNHLALATGHLEELEGISHPPLYLDPEKIPARHRGLIDLAGVLWHEAVQMGERYGYRNASVTAVAPTGTISYWLGAQTTGIEPDFTLVKVKALAGGGSLLLINQMVPRALEHLGYTPQEIETISAYMREKGFAEGAPGLQEEHVAVFDTAVSPWGTGRFVSVEGHLKMQSAIQAFTSMGISKTVNLPKDATPEDIDRIYRLAHKLGLKSVSIYRDGSKLSQVLNAASHEEKRFPVSLPDMGTVWLDDVRYRLVKAAIAPDQRGGWETGQGLEVKVEGPALAEEGLLFTSCDLKAGCPE